MAGHKPKIIYCGTDQFSVLVLEDLLMNFGPITCVITTPPRPAGRGLKVTNSAIFECCRKHRIKSIQPEDLWEDEFQPFLEEHKNDLFVLVSYGKILPQSMLKVLRYPVINLHPSLLPEWRGPSPIETALLNGADRTGVSIIALSGIVDGGDILAQKEIALDDAINAVALERFLAAEGAKLLADTIQKIMKGSVKAVPQDHSRVTQTRKIVKQDGLIDWNDTSRTLHNKIRALCVWPVASTSLHGKNLKIFSSALVSEAIGQGLPGEIIAIDSRFGVRVKTGDGALDIIEVQAEGKRRMDAFQFSLGARLKQGERLGAVS